MSAMESVDGYLGRFLAASHAAAHPPEPEPEERPDLRAWAIVDAHVRLDQFAEIVADRRRHGDWAILTEPPSVLRRRRAEWNDPDAAEAYIRRGPHRPWRRRR